MFEEYSGKKMSRQEIFNTFIGLAVAGQPDISAYPKIYITIDFIGTVDETEAYCEQHKGCICHGRSPRKSADVIHNSNATLTDMVGVWNTSVTSDGSMSNECIVLKQDGTGAFTEDGPECSHPTAWYIEDDTLHIHLIDQSICNHTLVYEPDVIVPSMSDGEYRFTRINQGAFSLPYYRKIEFSYTLDDWEEEAEAEYRYMAEHTPDFENIANSLLGFVDNSTQLGCGDRKHKR